MISIILAIVLGVAYTFVAIENSGSIPINFLGSTYSLPLYIFAAISFLVGMLIASLFHAVDKTTSLFDFRAKDADLRSASQTNENLKRELAKLATENANLREQLSQVRTDLREEKVETAKGNVRNFFTRIRHGFN